MNPWRIYQHWNPGRLIFGPKSLNELIKEISLRDAPLIITDKGVLNAEIFKKSQIKIIEEAGAVYQGKECTIA
jgi:alcohol dehydrogenase class IV